MKMENRKSSLPKDVKDKLSNMKNPDRKKSVSITTHNIYYNTYIINNIVLCYIKYIYILKLI